ARRTPQPRRPGASCRTDCRHGGRMSGYARGNGCNRRTPEPMDPRGAEPEPRRQDAPAVPDTPFAAALAPAAVVLDLPPAAPGRPPRRLGPFVVPPPTVRTALAVIELGAAAANP